MFILPRPLEGSLKCPALARHCHRSAAFDGKPDGLGAFGCQLLRADFLSRDLAIANDDRRESVLTEALEHLSQAGSIVGLPLISGGFFG
jgi:hypothetical protein